MADAQTQDEPFRLDPEATEAWRKSVDATSPGIASLVGGGDQGLFADKGLFSDMAGLARTKAAEDTAITRASDKRMAQDQARMDAAFRAEGASASELPRPWNADAMHQRYESNPIEGFGSIGGLFAVIASAFTKAPMENAINGMAGAINSIKQGNEEAYQRAYTAWKDNTQLALQRFKTQHELYQDATALFDHDAAAANAKLHNTAVRFGDNQMLMLAEHGMVKEIFELQAARAKSAEQMADLEDKMTFRSFQKAAMEAELRNIPPSGDENKDKLIKAVKMMQILNPQGRPNSAEQEAIGAYVMKTNPNDPKYIDGLIDIHQQFSTRGPNIEGYQAARQAEMDANQGKISPDKDAELLQKFGLSGRLGAAGGTGTSSQAIKARAIQEIMDQHKAEGKPISTAEAEHEYNVTRAAPTGNQIDVLQGKVDQAERIIDGSEKNIDFLRTYKGGAGLLGKIMRGEEIATNIAGISTESERVAFRRRVHELQEMAPRIITDAQGRPLKSAQEKVDDVVAGLQAGDTGPNTIRAYEDLIAEMKVRIQKYRERQGKVAPTSTETAPAGSTDWLSAYPEKR